MEIRSIIEVLLAIDCLLLSIEQSRLSKRLKDLSREENEVKNNEIRRD